MSGEIMRQIYYTAFEAMKPFVVAMAVPILALSLLGCSGNERQASEDRPPETQPLTEKVFLSKARSEITKLGITPPDKEMMNALEQLGFKPKVTPFNDGWAVSHPLGHPWAISWIHLEMDSQGRVLKHRIEPGQ